MESEKQRKFDQRYLEMARIWAKNSYCTRRQVGALVVKNNMIISDGYNGTPSGFENVCEDDNGITKPYVLHAEANAITKLARSSNNSEGATHPGRHQARGLWREIPPHRRHRTVRARRHRGRLSGRIISKHRIFEASNIEISN